MDNGGGNNLENVIDRILFSARGLKKKLESVKENNSESELDARLNQYRQTQKLNELERENLELKQALEDHQYGLEFIMSKYRSQVVELIRLNKIEKNMTPPNTIGLKRNNSVD